MTLSEMLAHIQIQKAYEEAHDSLGIPTIPMEGEGPDLTHEGEGYGG